MEKLQLHIESLIFSSSKPLRYKEIKVSLEEALVQKFDDEVITEHIEASIAKYKSDNYPFEIVELAEGFQFLTKGAYHSVIASLLKLQSKKKLSKTAVETLSIIAYKQPVTKSDIEHVRGVNTDYTVQKLLEKELIEIAGRSEGPGRALLYKTSEKFMNYFALKSLNELPKLKEFEIEENTIGFQDSDENPTPQVIANNEEE